MEIKYKNISSEKYFNISYKEKKENFYIKFKYDTSPGSKFF